MGSWKKCLDSAQINKQTALNLSSYLPLYKAALIAGPGYIIPYYHLCCLCPGEYDQAVFPFQFFNYSRDTVAHLNIYSSVWFPELLNRNYCIRLVSYIEKDGIRGYFYYFTFDRLPFSQFTDAFSEKGLERLLFPSFFGPFFLIFLKLRLCLIH